MTQMNKSRYSVRYARQEDISALFQISVKVHQASYAALIPAPHRADFDARYTINTANETRYTRRMMSRLQNPAWRIWVVTEVASQRVIGYTLAEVKGHDFLQKRGLFVLPEYQGQGIGRQLFSASLDAIASGTVRLSVIGSNKRAIGLYEKFGFMVIGQDDTSFFGAPQIVMELDK